MQIVIIGHGKMGKIIEETARHRGHEIIAICDNRKDIEAQKDGYIAIDFTEPKAFKENYKLLADKFQVVIVGTSGWNDIEQEVFDYFSAKKHTLIYASNFSIGVNIFSHLVGITAKLIAGLGNYDPYLIEMHHSEKKDAPSGTALMLDKIIKSAFGRSANPVSVRCGQIKGMHEIGFESEVDKIILKHEAYSRKGFAEGAVIAAELAEAVSGVWNFKDLLDSKFKEILGENSDE